MEIINDLFLFLAGLEDGVILLLQFLPFFSQGVNPICCCHQLRKRGEAIQPNTHTQRSNSHSSAHAKRLTSSTILLLVFSSESIFA